MTDEVLTAAQARVRNLTRARFADPYIATLKERGMEEEIQQAIRDFDERDAQYIAEGDADIVGTYIRIADLVDEWDWKVGRGLNDDSDEELQESKEEAFYDHECFREYLTNIYPGSPYSRVYELATHLTYWYAIENNWFNAPEDDEDPEWETPVIGRQWTSSDST
jgi:hypothetical protein